MRNAVNSYRTIRKLLNRVDKECIFNDRHIKVTFKVVIVDWRMLHCQFFDHLNGSVGFTTLILILLRNTILSALAI